MTIPLDHDGCPDLQALVERAGRRHAVNRPHHVGPRGLAMHAFLLAATLMMAAVKLPRRGRGRPSPSADAIYRAKVASWCALILEINSSMDFSVGARGWCYILENRNALSKGDFDVAEKLITDCRKTGDLPLDICAEDDARETIGLQKIATRPVEKEATDWIDWLRNHAHKQYTPISFWDDL